MEGENSSNFYTKLNYIVNSKFNFGEKIENSKIVRKHGP